METSIGLWLVFTALVLVFLAFDLCFLNKESREIGVAKALKLSAGYVAVALLFNAGVFWYFGEAKGLEFLTGYVVEKSLRLDNVFVISLIFGTFTVPKECQHRVLFLGILGALVTQS